MRDPGTARLARMRRRVSDLAHRVWRGVLWFLEVIGLRRTAPVGAGQQLARFKLYYAEFRQLLSANHSFLGELTDLEQRLVGGDPFDAGYVRRKVLRMVADLHRMVRSLNTIGEGRYATLPPALDRIVGALESATAERDARPAAPLCVALDHIRAGDASLCGGKMANLGEIRALGMCTPEGFAITTEAYRLLCDENRLGAFIEQEHLRLRSPAEVDEVSRVLGQQILEARVPPRLAEEMATALGDLLGKVGVDARLAVRSSATDEDGARSFAGQYTTELEVRPADLGDAYQRVLTSLYAPGPLDYRLLHGIPGETAEMAVGCLAMVDARVSGVAFSHDPSQPRTGEILVHAVPGLGAALVDGSAAPAAYRVVPHGGGDEVRRSAPGGAAAECLSDGEAVAIAEAVRRLEAHFAGAQDVEWALDQARRLVLLQARPLRAVAGEAARTGCVEGATVLVAGGEIACPGIGAGPAVHLDPDGDLESFPAGGVLVARRPSPRYVRVMGKASAIITDAGSTTGHMASLAREFKVPTLLNLGTATSAVRPGAVVTVDAGSGHVYAGEVASLVAGARGLRPAEARQRGGPAAALLARAAELIVPLNLADPRAPDFAPVGCRTLHDLARYMHEKSYEEMFGMGTRLGDFRPASYRLDVFLPIDLYIIDLGEGLAAEAGARTVTREAIRSRPLVALLTGMLDERLPRYGPRPMDMGGFFSIMARHALEGPENERTFRDPCYAIVSDRYLNYTARVGYHFSAVDTYCGRTPNKNYISFRFKGGAADDARRVRRARCIGTILTQSGFSVERKGDLVNARLSKGTREETSAHLTMIGRLLQFMRQMDVAMATDEAAAFIERAFLDGNYGLRPGPADAPGPAPSDA